MGCPSPLTMPFIADSDCDGQHTFVLGVQPLRRSVKEGNPHRENRASRQLHGRKLCHRSRQPWRHAHHGGGANDEPVSAFDHAAHWMMFRSEARKNSTPRQCTPISCGDSDGSITMCGKGAPMRYAMVNEHGRARQPFAQLSAAMTQGAEPGPAGHPANEAITS